MKLLTLILDFLFPPSKEALKLRSLSPEEINRELPPAPASPYHYINSLFAYKDPLASELIWSIKYKRDKHAIKCGGFALYKALENKQAVLVPIPVSKERRKERGYNQCELLVDEMVRISEGKLEKRF
ncbi:MAG: hypothetical protein Q8Q03_03010, partial [bacterium]|nr:hypothetical protein [bacterium]